MPIHYEVLVDKRLAVVTASELLSTDDVLLTMEAMLADPNWQNGFAILCDFSAVTDVAMSGTDVRLVADRDRVLDARHNESRIAVVATSELTYGLVRMWQAHSEDTGPRKAVFRDVDAAREWLGLPVDA